MVGAGMANGKPHEIIPPSRCGRRAGDRLPA